MAFRQKSAEEDLIPIEDFCFSIVDDIVEKILDDQLEKYHEEEVIPWTVAYLGDLLKDVLNFAVRRSGR